MHKLVKLPELSLHLRLHLLLGCTLLLQSERQ